MVAGVVGICFFDPVSTMTVIGSALATVPVAAGIAQSIDFGVTFVGSFFKGPEWGGQRFNNSMNIIGGLFQTDENKGFWSNAWTIFSRWTWESPQTIAGLGYSHLRNFMGNVDRVDYLGGATYVTDENKSGDEWGMTLGSYINMSINDKITGNFTDYVITHPMYMHEYGHTIDSRNYGLAYLFAIGIPSLDSANGSKSLTDPPFSTHRGYWTEKRANYFAKKYFGKYYGVDWNMNYHPSWYPRDGEWRKDENGKRYYYYYTLNDFYPTMW